MVTTLFMGCSNNTLTHCGVSDSTVHQFVERDLKSTLTPVKFVDMPTLIKECDLDWVVGCTYRDPASSFVLDDLKGIYRAEIQSHELFHVWQYKRGVEPIEIDAVRYGRKVAGALCKVK